MSARDSLEDDRRDAVIEAARKVVELRRPNWPKELWCGVRASEMGDLEAALMQLDLPATPVCTGYCIGTARAETLVEDLCCPVHGIDAQAAAERVFPDRQAWLDSLAEARNDA